MKQKQPHHEIADKDEGSEPEAGTPMANFKSLTRSLLKVTRAELQVEQKRYQESRLDRSVKKTVGSSGGSSRKRK
jgi:hypothetical protein